MTWCWFAATDEPAQQASKRVPVSQAVRIDARLIDPTGDAAWISLAIVSEATAPLFDDPAVSEAMRATLRAVPPAAVSTLVRDASLWAGSVTVWRDPPWTSGAEDPFARVHPARLLHVAAGLFATVPAPCGPAIQRVGGELWPAVPADGRP